MKGIMKQIRNFISKMKRKRCAKTCGCCVVCSNFEYCKSVRDELI